ncbi:hypothetical protein NA78x_006198 [Anatilimnocola sp. NA78]|uniref:hypothetical protein n=1 Tax=Anatilimnocola sp. NA78 TaxID=3415683 RepID=UPI003CE470FA
MLIRDRIQAFRRIPASQLLPNPRNWRTHPPAQQRALRSLLNEVGYAGALLARELPNGSLQLIDGHLRAETTPDQLVPVLVLDVNEDEANKLLAFYDPLGGLAGRDEEQVAALAALVETSSGELQNLLDQLQGEISTANHRLADDRELEPSYQLVVQCAGESEQRALFERFTADGLRCRVLTM